MSVFLWQQLLRREVEHRVLYFERGPFRRVAAPAEPEWQDEDTGLLPARALAFQSVINLPAYQSDGFDYLDLYGDNEDGAGSGDYFGLQDHYKPEGADAVSVLLGRRWQDRRRSLLQGRLPRRSARPRPRPADRGTGDRTHRA